MPTHTDNNTEIQDADLIWRKLTLSVNHSADDLKLHTQRILFCLDNNLSDFSAGALQDLFITLQDKGKGLRLRMFNLISPLLDYSERRYFQQSMEGIESNDDLPIFQCYRGSVLAEKNYQCDDKSNGQLPITVEFNNKSEEANYLMASGKLSEAKIMLESIFLGNNDKQVSEALQTYYFYSKDKEGLERFMGEMSQKKRNLSSSWVALQTSAEMW
ncbi:MAG: hypothetical protein V3V19_03305 [Cocleimonas sp.]